MAFDFEKAKKRLSDRNEIKAQERAEGKGRGGNDIKWWAIPPDIGSYTVRFLLPDHEDGVPGTLVSSHKDLPSTDVPKISCFRMFEKEDHTHLECPICKLLEDYDGRINTEMWQRKTKSFHNVLVMDDPTKPDTPKDVPHLMGSSDYNYDWLIASCSDPSIGDITDIMEGSDVKFTRKVRGGAFDRSIARKSRPIAASDAEAKALLTKCFDSSKIWKRPDDETYKKMKIATNALKQELDRRLKSKDSFITEEYPAVAEVKAAAKGEKKAGIAKPSGAPDCFSKHTVGDPKCDTCGHEFACSSSSAIPF